MKKRIVASFITVFAFALSGCSFSFNGGSDKVIDFSYSDSQKNNYHTHSIFDNDNGLVVETINKTGQVKAITDYTYTVTNSLSEEIDTSTYFPSAGGYKVTIHVEGLSSKSYSINVSLYVPVTGVSIDGGNTEVRERGKKQLSYTIFPSNASIKKVTWSSDDTTIAKIDADGKLTGVHEGTTTIRATTVDGGFSDAISVEVTPSPVEQTKLLYTYNDLQNNNRYDVDGTPLTNSKLLVIPVWFSDSTTYISSSKKESVRSDIEKVYFGTEEETGWHSVSSYYAAESFGACNMTGTVSDWYSPGISSREATEEVTTNLVLTATEWYFKGHPLESRKDYDLDNNGYLDGVCLIYAAADYRTDTRGDVNKNLWAYCYWVQDSSQKSKTNPGANVYFFASYDFMYGSGNVGIRTGKNYYNGDSSHFTVDAHTYIHETGHMLGLDDYYDYGPNDFSPAGAFSMQDYNVGGHDPYSVMAFGWADPYIPTDSCVLEIGAFQTTHELILLSPDEVNSPFDEYLLLELYTPTGLNKMDSLYKYSGSYPQGPSSTGIRLWHVDARLLKSPYSSISNITTNPKINYYGTTHAMSNTYDDEDYGSPLGSSYYDYNLLQLIRDNTGATYRPSGELSNSDLFVNGESFSMSKYSSQFVKGTNINKGKALGWSFSVTINGSGESATATINLVRS